MEVIGIVSDHIRLPGAVNILALAEALGIDYFEDDISDNVTICISRERTIIRVDRHLPEAQRRFAGAHAIAHYILHSDILANSREVHRDTLFGDNKRHSGGSITDNYQKQANKMAVQLLMPVARLHALMTEHSGDPEAIAAEFDLPVEMVKIRIDALLKSVRR